MRKLRNAVSGCVRKVHTYLTQVGVLGTFRNMSTQGCVVYHLDVGTIVVGESLLVIIFLVSKFIFTTKYK